MSVGDLGVSAFPEGDSLFTWIDTIEGLSYKLSLHFPLEYPFKPPQVKFETTCFHPNVDQFGNICLDILQPNPESPPNTYAAALWNKKEGYRKMVQKQYFGGKAYKS